MVGMRGRGQRPEVALRQKDIIQVELVELRLMGFLVGVGNGRGVVGVIHPLRHPFYEQVVEGTVLDELQRTP